MSASRQKRQFGQGFTLLEIMAVIVIIGLLAAVSAPRYLGRLNQSRWEETRITMERIRVALEFYRADNGRFPTARQGLSALTAKSAIPPVPAVFPVQGYLDALALKDAWRRPFLYDAEDDGHGPFRLRSLGADGKEGGAGPNSDLLLR